MTEPTASDAPAQSSAENGFTLLELMVSMFISSIVILATSSFLASTLRWESAAAAKVQAIDQAKLATQEIDRQATSALVIYDPSTEGSQAGTSPDGSAIPAGFSLRIYTESNGAYNCQQWRVLDTGLLQTRTWQPDWTSGMPVSVWQTVASNVSNTASQPPFVLDTNTGFGGPGSSGGANSARLLDLTLLAGGTKTGSGATLLQSSVDGRDVGYLLPASSACSTVPPA